MTKQLENVPDAEIFDALSVCGLDDRMPAPAVPLGVSSLLPELATGLLTSAARRAAQKPAGSLERRRIIEEAIAVVKKKWPEYFRRD